MDYEQYQQLEFRRKFWKLMGAEIKVTLPESDQVVGTIKMKAWKLKEDIRLYKDSSQEQELLKISARSVLDFATTYDVIDSPSNENIFSLRRKALMSAFVRDHWDIYDSSGAIIGRVQETSSTLALLRRWIELIPIVGIISIVFAFITQTYTITVGSETLAIITHRKNPFIIKMNLEFAEGTKSDKRIGVAAVSLLSVIDGAKN